MTTALMILGTAVSTVGALSEGAAAKRSADYQAKVAEMNAKIATQNAERAVNRSQVEAQDSDTETLAMLGELEASQGASGLAITGRSAGGARKSVRTIGRLDALRIREAGELEAYGYKTDNVNMLAEARAKRMEGKAARTASFFNAGSSLISGASKVAGQRRSLAR